LVQRTDQIMRLCCENEKRKRGGDGGKRKESILLKQSRPLDTTKSKKKKKPRRPILEGRNGSKEGDDQEGKRGRKHRTEAQTQACCLRREPVYRGNGKPSLRRLEIG